MATPPHILIAGPTASGKSALALTLAARLGATVVNADALQVYAGWRILTARPSDADMAAAPHALYGHVPQDMAYSVGDWLRDLAQPLGNGMPLILVGGTGLYLTAASEGLAEIPAVPAAIRAEADTLLGDDGAAAFEAYLSENDAEILNHIDRRNPRRLQRAYEVHRATGTPLSVWQARPTTPVLPGDRWLGVVLDAPRDWLAERIARRFRAMLGDGALEEVRAQKPYWDATAPASKALGAAELLAFLNGKISLEAAVEKGIIATRQYAKRQRTWFRSRMADWAQLDATEAQPALVEQIVARQMALFNRRG
ncbi:MAG: tRNA (adenosine(37)-N6)-dimethylallyltransferase MiaA [Pseudomonadota bacterium]